MFENCRIRLVSWDDLEMLLAWRNHVDVRRFMFTQHKICLEEHRNWFAKATQDPNRRLLIIEEAQQAIGYVQFRQVDKEGIANWGFYASPDGTKGTGLKIGVTALDYAFSSLKLRKVCGQAIESNQASINFHKRLGFTLEGVLRDQIHIEDSYHNLHCFGLFATEWQLEKFIQE